MAGPRSPVTMLSLAREAGVSQSTVSLALRDDPRISPETKKRVQRLARKRGYTPDPALSALVAYRTRTRPIGDYGKIAVLHDFDREEKRFPLASRQQVEGIRHQARRLGYDIELFRVHSDEASSLRLSRMLYARGIRGLILLALRMPSLCLQWDHFSSVVIGEYFSSPRLNHVNHHHSAVLTSIYQELRKLGYRKIGFCNIRISEERKHHLYLGAYLKCLYLDGIAVEDSPPFFYNEEDDWSPLAWLDRHSFDAVMSMVPHEFLKRLKGSRYRVPRNLGLAGYSIPLNDPQYPFSGYALDYSRMGAAAVDLLQSMIHLGRRGVPKDDEYFDLLIRGRWVARSTTRKVELRTKS
jgi:LacI family transcriptional regulator